MSERVVYLLGAGASCGHRDSGEAGRYGLPKQMILPLVTEFTKAAQGVLSSILLKAEHRGSLVIEHYPEHLKHFAKEFKALNERVGRSYSVDTIAKMELLSNDKGGFQALKNFTGLVLEFYELDRQLDVRYESFLSSIMSLDDLPKLPDNLTIFSWNYDAQIEKFAQRIAQNKDANQISSFLNRNTFSKENFSLNKLNGDIINSLNTEALFKNYTEAPEIARALIDKRYSEGQKKLETENYFPNLKYAWEHSKEEIERWANSIKYAEELVVIGYSFPSFNREVDDALLRSFVEGAGSDKVSIVVQCAGASENVKNKILQRLRGMDVQYPEMVKIETVSETREFYLSPKL